MALTPHSGSAHEGSKTTQKDSKQQGVHRPTRLQDAAAAPEGAEERLRAAGAPEGAGERLRAASAEKPGRRRGRMMFPSEPAEISG